MKACCTLAAMVVCAVLACSSGAQNAPSTSTVSQSTSSGTPPPGPPTTPAVSGPLQLPGAIGFEAGPLGMLNVDGILSATGLSQGNYFPGDSSTQAAVSNGQVFLQKTSGWWQFYVQAGAYNILSLGLPFLPTTKAIDNLYGAVPVAYVKFVPAKNTSILIGELPTIMGAESTFDFQNMNIERGLLWNQENAINRGIQVNQTLGKFSLWVGWNDGYYSNKYTWLSGSLGYTSGPHSLVVSGMGNLSQTPRQTLATPVQNNGSMYAVIYTYTKAPWVIQPYAQFGFVPTNRQIGIAQGASTQGGALLVSRTLKRGFSLAGRGEYISSTGTVAQNPVNLLYGPGSAGWSATLTPTFQYKRFFTRADLSFVRTSSFTPGAAFGPNGMNANQPRAVVEMGFMF